MHSLEELMPHGGWRQWTEPARIEPETPIVPGAVPGVWPRWTKPARIERETPIVPGVVAVAVWEEAQAWLGEELPRVWRVFLAESAEAVYASNPRIRRRLRGPGNGGRDWLWVFMRHWLAGLIHGERPDLYERLPGSFAQGHPLPSRHDACIWGSACAAEVGRPSPRGDGTPGVLQRSPGVVPGLQRMASRKARRLGEPSPTHG